MPTTPLSMLNPLFSCAGLQMEMIFLQASFAGNKQISGNASVCAKQVAATHLRDTLKTLRSDQIWCWSVGTCAQANVTGSKGGDGFLRGMHACDGFLHGFFFCRKTHDDRFHCPLFLVTDCFVAVLHASQVHLGAVGSQNHNGTDHWVKLVVKTDASC